MSESNNNKPFKIHIFDMTDQFKVSLILLINWSEINLMNSTQF